LKEKSGNIHRRGITGRKGGATIGMRQIGVKKNHRRVKRQKETEDLQTNAKTGWTTFIQ